MTRNAILTAATLAALAASVVTPAISAAAETARPTAVVKEATSAAPTRVTVDIPRGERMKVAAGIRIPAHKTLWVLIHDTDDTTKISTCATVCKSLSERGSADKVASAANRPVTVDLTMRALTPTGRATTVTFSYWVA
ncbi:hypothetical protein [Streptomyces sp. SP17KL33]|uniref:hypothetical protein n=1 Tax=Streptomyces sp. SP17KL33 TaxID=3002534 RepID=UPI002E76AFAD|nr:hypothetical protein [Streptomyces sp. SP17KL33]MEE1829484.1 hypothetical protein [Streptomyces sp. SP17KL33]